MARAPSREPVMTGIAAVPEASLIRFPLKSRSIWPASKLMTGGITSKGRQSVRLITYGGRREVVEGRGKGGHDAICRSLAGTMRYGGVR